MNDFAPRLSRRVVGAAAASILTISAAGAATFHSSSVATGTGSNGATSFVQNSPTGSALQGEVNSSANTTIHIPFGVLGEYDASGSTFGIGVAGISSTGYAVAAESFASSGPAMLALAGGNGSGLEAYTQQNSNAPAVFGEASGPGAGVMGEVTDGESYAAVYGNDIAQNDSGTDGVLGATGNDGFGVEGQSSDGAEGGVAGSSTDGVGVTGASDTGIGILGVNDTRATPPPNATLDALSGVEGDSNYGPGLYALSTYGYALYGITGGSIGENVEADGASGIGVQTDAELVGFQTVAAGNVAAYPYQAAGMTGTNYGVVASTVPGLGTQYPLALYSGETEVGFVDNTGDVNIAGTYETTLSQPIAGTAETSYVPTSSTPTIEDVASAQLVSGVATVRFDPTLVAALDRTSAYHVFLTPEGDTNGLYVAQKTPAGFVVRETRGGHGTFAFDYRVVGSVAGQAAKRMAFTAGFGTRKSAILGQYRAPHRPAALRPHAALSQRAARKFAAWRAARARTRGFTPAPVHGLVSAAPIGHAPLTR